MALIGIVLLIIFVISAILLVLIVLIQDDKGEGLGNLFASSSANTIGNRSGNILTRITTVLGILFLACSFFLSFINRTPEKGDVLGEANKQKSSIDWWNVTQNEQTQPDLTPAPAPESKTDKK